MTRGRQRAAEDTESATTMALVITACCAVACIVMFFVLPALNSPSQQGTASASLDEKPTSEPIRSILMFPPFEGGQIRWEPFNLPVVPATRTNVRAYRTRMAELYDYFMRASDCRTDIERVKMKGALIIQADSVIGFDGVEVPDSYVSWTKLFVQVVQIQAEAMNEPWGIAEHKFLARHNFIEKLTQANAMLEDLTENPRTR